MTPGRTSDGRRCRAGLLLALAARAAAPAPAALPAAPAPVASTPPAPGYDAWATDVLNRWILAIGDPYEIRELRTVDSQCKIDYGNGGAPVDLHIRAVAKDTHYRYDYSTPVYGTLTQAFNGTVAWQRNEQLGFGPISALDHHLNRLSCDFRAPMRVSTLYPGRRKLPDETIDGRKLVVLEMVSPGGQKEKWYFDPATGLRVRIELSYLPVPATIDFDDFRPAFGANVKEPYHIVRRQRGRTIDIRMQVILYNEDMDEALFSPPLAAIEENEQIERVLDYNTYFRGAEASRNVRTRVAEQEVAVTTAGMQVRRVTYQQRPNLLAIEEDVPGMGQVWQGFDGEIGWAWSEVEGFRRMEGAELQQMLGSADFDGPLRLSALCPLRRWLGDKEVGGRQLIGIALATIEGPAGTFYFDPHTYELAQLETYVQAGANGRMRVLVEFGDYRAVEGMRVPFRTVVSNAAMRTVVTTRSIRHNVPIDESVFKPRRE